MEAISSERIQRAAEHIINYTTGPKERAAALFAALPDGVRRTEPASPRALLAVTEAFGMLGISVLDAIRPETRWALLNALDLREPEMDVRVMYGVPLAACEPGPHGYVILQGGRERIPTGLFLAQHAPTATGTSSGEKPLAKLFLPEETPEGAAPQESLQRALDSLSKSGQSLVLPAGAEFKPAAPQHPNPEPAAGQIWTWPSLVWSFPSLAQDGVALIAVEADQARWSSPTSGDVALLTLKWNGRCVGIELPAGRVMVGERYAYRICPDIVRTVLRVHGADRVIIADEHGEQDYLAADLLVTHARVEGQWKEPIAPGAVRALALADAMRPAASLPHLLRDVAQAGEKAAEALVASSKRLGESLQRGIASNRPAAAPTHRCPRCRAITSFEPFSSAPGSPADYWRCPLCRQTSTAAELIPLAPATAPEDSRAVLRRELDKLLREDARRFPAFAEARRAAVLAQIEALGDGQVEAEGDLSATTLKKISSRLLTQLRTYEDWRGCGQRPSGGAAEYAAAHITPSAIGAYERARSSKAIQAAAGADPDGRARAIRAAFGGEQDIATAFKAPSTPWEFVKSNNSFSAPSPGYSLPPQRSAADQALLAEMLATKELKVRIVGPRAGAGFDPAAGPDTSAQAVVVRCLRCHRAHAVEVAAGEAHVAPPGHRVSGKVPYEDVSCSCGFEFIVVAGPAPAEPSLAAHLKL